MSPSSLEGAFLAAFCCPADDTGALAALEAGALEAVELGCVNGKRVVSSNINQQRYLEPHTTKKSQKTRKCTPCEDTSRFIPTRSKAEFKAVL